MEMIIGRLGDQKLQIRDKTVSRHHCKLTINDNGQIHIDNLSPNGTYINGVRLESADVKKTDLIGLGSNFTSTIAELMVIRQEEKQQNQIQGQTDESKPILEFDFESAKSYTNYKIVLKKFKSLSLLECLYSAAEQSQAQLPKYVLPVIKSAIASKYLRSGKYAQAQQFIYDAGDNTFEIQDGTAESESAYASMMTLLSELYLSIFQNDKAEIAAQYATGIFNRWTPGELYIYPSIVADAYSVYGDALNSNGKHTFAIKCYDRAIELYNQAGLEDPTYYNVKIVEVENKKNKTNTLSKASIAPWIKRCCTCMYWCGHAEPNTNVSLVYYTPGEWAKCTKTYRGSATGQPAEQSCANWEQRFLSKKSLEDNESMNDIHNNKQRSINQDFTTSCPKCGKYSFTFRMNANTSSGKSYGKCNKCHYQAEVKYQNDSFDTRVIKIG